MIHLPEAPVNPIFIFFYDSEEENSKTYTNLKTKINEGFTSFVYLEINFFEKFEPLNDFPIFLMWFTSVFGPYLIVVLR